MSHAAPTAEAARRAWQRLAAAGGVISRSELQERWSLSRSRAHQITIAEHFPAPVIEGTRGHAAVWLVADVEHWRCTHTPERGPLADRPALTDAETTPEVALRAWHQLQRAGGLATVQRLATEWGISVTAAAKRTAAETFPPDVMPGRWIAAEALQT